jgi:hypothetical protein
MAIKSEGKPIKVLSAKKLANKAIKILESGNDENLGICRHCGAERDGCEPDARNYPCENCGLHEVFGAEEILMMYAA